MGKKKGSQLTTREFIGAISERILHSLLANTEHSLRHAALSQQVFLEVFGNSLELLSLGRFRYVVS